MEGGNPRAVGKGRRSVRGEREGDRTLKEQESFRVRREKGESEAEKGGGQGPRGQ